MILAPSLIVRWAKPGIVFASGRLSLFIAILIGTLTMAWTAVSRAENTRIVGYYASWSATEGFLPKAVDATHLTHINYAFANISENGSVVLGDPCLDAGECDGAQTLGNLQQLSQIKRQHSQLKLLISIGGWRGSKRFSDVALTHSSRAVFIRSAIKVFLERWPGLVDGFDLDWEYPVAGGAAENTSRPEDKSNFTSLVKEFRNELSRASIIENRALLLTAALPAAHLENIEPDKVAPYLDWLNLMTYDYGGSSRTYFNAPLCEPADGQSFGLNVNTTVKGYLSFGVPPEKLVIGIPFFGYRYKDVSPVRNGLFQEHGAVEYDSFRNLRRLTANNGYSRFWESQAKVPWFFNEETHTFVTFDDMEALTEKARYVRDHKLGGVMIWELRGDDGTLLSELAQSLKH
jgi:chitinase